MKYQVITLFPELFRPFLESTLLARAKENALIEAEIVQLRNYAINTQGQVDDTPYGGGGGMISRVEASVAAVEDAKKKDPNAKVILFTPRGQAISQKLVKEITKEAVDNQSGLILYCSRYEGVDERFVESWVDYEISIGDAIYMGGEAPAIAFMEATARLIPGVLGNSVSLEDESFELGGVEYPQYTKPQTFRGRKVPDILLSGNHGEIAKWQKIRSIEDTSLRRPDLVSDSIKNSISSGDEIKKKEAPVYLALLHHPVVDKAGEVITSSITNLDVHDIARSVRTFELDGYFVVHPSKTLRALVQRVCDHWSEGAGVHYNPNRSEALQFIRSVATFDDMLSMIEKEHGELPRLVVTSARPGERMIAYDEFRSLMPSLGNRPILLLFGTAWGIHSDITDRADYRLLPIWGPGDYNHLSVRSAVAIILDRLFGF